jgi:hypothetical protein
LVVIRRVFEAGLEVLKAKLAGSALAAEPSAAADGAGI